MRALAFALVLSLSLLGAERARAADLPLPGGAPIPPSSYYPVSPPINWGGVYIGLNGGYGLGKSNWSGATGSGSCSALGVDILGAGATCQTRIDWLSTFRLRAGYTWSHFLFYATAGGAAGDFRLSTQPTGATHNPSPPLGWTAGAGVEYLFDGAIS